MKPFRNKIGTLLWILLGVFEVFGVFGHSFAMNFVNVETFEVAHSPKLTLHGTAKRNQPSSPGAISNFSVNIEIPKNLKLKIKENQYLTVLLPLSVNPKSVQARVTKYENQELQFQFRFPAYTIEGMDVSTKLSIESPQLFNVPLNSIVSPLGDKTFIYLVSQNKAIRHEVEIVDFFEMRVLVQLKTDANDLEQHPIIISGHYNLMPGDQVEAIR